jgi:hypothetical protein
MAQETRCAGEAHAPAAALEHAAVTRNVEKWVEIPACNSRNSGPGNQRMRPGAKGLRISGCVSRFNHNGHTPGNRKT